MGAANIGRTFAVLWVATSCFLAGHASHMRSHEHLHNLRHLSRREVSGVSMFDDGSLSYLGLASECETALYQKVSCDDAISSLTTDGYVGGPGNSTVCDTDCEGSIAKFHSSVLASCGESAELVPGLPFLGLVDQVWSNWNQSCFVDPDTGKNCNDVIAAFPDVDMLDLPTSDLCSYCNTKKLAMMQADAYTEAYTEDWQSTYKSVAQACNLTVSDFNATDSAFNVTVPTSTPDCVSGNTYTTKEGDTCDSIALAQGVSAATMFYINPDILNCTSILAGTSLCLPQQCEDLYTVQPNDTCIDIAIDSNIRTQALLTYNSQLNWNCSNLHSTNPYWGTTLCVSPPGGTYTGQARNSSGSTGSDVVNPPVGSTVASGTTTDCGAWYVYDASQELSCTQICLLNQIAIKLFTEANPSLNKTTCDSDLVSGKAYCVNPLDGWNWGSGTNSTVPSSTPTVTAATTPPAATQTGIPANCNAYYVAKSGQDCGTLEALFGITDAQFHAWNPAVSSDCVTGFMADEAYCVGVSSSTSATKTTPKPTSTKPASATTSSVKPPGPTQSGIPANCNKYYVAKAGDNCNTIAEKYGITSAQFHSWNPAVSSDCATGFMADEAYCVGVPGATTSKPTTTSNTVKPPGPTQSGIAANCNKYYVAESGDNCDTIVEKYGITSAQFHSWNPAVSSDCVTGFMAEEAYCVGVSGAATTKPTTTSNTSVKPPGPTQSGIPANCSEYYVAKAGEDCSTVVEKFGITNAQFHAWNPAVSSDCVSGFMADEAYCVAVA